MHAPSSPLQCRFALSSGLAAVAIRIAAGIAEIEQLFKDSGVGDGGIRGDDFANELMAFIDARMQLVAEIVLAMLFGPPRIDVFFRAFVGFPSNGHRDFLDSLDLLALVVLHRRLYQ